MSRLRLPSVLLVALATACASPAPEPADPAAAEAAMAESLAAFGAAAIAGDVELAATYLTDDVVLREPGMLLTKAEWLAMVTEIVGAGGGILSFETEPADTFLHGDVAYQVGTYDEVLAMGGQEQMILGNYFVRFEQGADGVWRIDRLVVGSREAPPAPEM